MPSDNNRPGKGFALIVSVVAIMAVWRRATRASVDVARSNSRESSLVGKGVKDSRNGSARGRWIRLLWPVSCLMLTGISILLFRSHHVPAAGSVLLVAAVLSTIFVLSPRWRQDRRTGGSLILLGAAPFYLLVVVAARGIVSATTPVALIRFVIFGLIGMGLAGIAIAKSLAPSKAAESIGLLAAAVSLMIVCLPGLVSLTEPLRTPVVNGSGQLFVSDPHNQAVVLRVQTYSPSSFEGFRISTAGHRRIPWVLAVSGDARMIGLTEAPSVRVRTISDNTGGPSGLQKVQLFSGYVGGASSVDILGTAIGTFADSNRDRISVALPYYAIGGAGYFSSKTMAEIAGLLGSQPTTPSRSRVEVDSGPIGPPYTVTASIPSPLPTQFGSLEWTTYQGTPIGYTLLNQDLADFTNTALFLLAFLLGVSGAGLFAGLQAGIHRYLSNWPASP
jgi:hypothetical protein